MAIWEPAAFDPDIENKPGWKKAYTVAIPNLPLFPNKKVIKFIKKIQTMDGFIGVRPEYPYGTLMVFDTENNAKIARNRIKVYPGYEGTVGKNIGVIYIPERAEESI